MLTSLIAPEIACKPEFHILFCSQFLVQGSPPARMITYLESTSCWCQINAFHLVIDVYELDASGLGKNLNYHEKKKFTVIK